MHIKRKTLLSIFLCVYCVFGKVSKNGNKLFINVFHNNYKSKCSSLLKKNTSFRCTKKCNREEPCEGKHNECSMHLRILKKNENVVIENLKKRGMEKNIIHAQILKNLKEEKNKFEILRNDLRNRRKILSEQVKNLMFAQNSIVHYATKDKEEKKKNSLINGNNENDKELNESDLVNTFGKKEENGYDDNQDEQPNLRIEDVKKQQNLKNTNCDEKQIEQVKNQINEINGNINLIETKILNLKCKIDEHLNILPNILLDMVPDGKTMNKNKIVKTYKIKNIKIGKDNKFLEPHEDILKRYDNNNIFSNITNKIGFGYNILVNNIAKLERALINFMINTHVDKFLYTYVKTPVIVTKSALTNTGQLPKFENDLFKINNNYKILNEEAYLIPTSEVSLLNLFRNTILNHENLPIKLVSHSSCFRIEKNFTYGKASKGLLREHIFEKVELINISDKKTSHMFYNDLIKQCEYILKKLKIPYRLVLLNSFETPFAASICYDIEAWLPSQNRFIEVSSCSNCLDFQSRKLNLKYRKAENNYFCHTINGSGLAVGRVLAIILEQYQIQRTSKGEQNQLTIPKALRKFMNAATINL
ncbi:serine--tRNA ligase [Plasmodium gonderi]|uniref:serine--tRNA ligase n=1 Tax=Plasmodium gonderi TaxID=77519 RepID=A0A1Y1JRU4_PLAGO|nr:serine--tRNA ligase [Plasmodium gonderi]GAW83542.1 serine--tRNA ligase [Plasmodium gonderi]